MSSHPSHTRFRLLTACLSAGGLTVLALAGPATHAAAGAIPTGGACLRAVQPGSSATLRERVFRAASASYGVPRAVLEGVSYLESRWDDHGSSPSTAGGYGPMHLTNVTPPPTGMGKDTPTAPQTAGPASLHTAARAAALTGFTVRQLTSGGPANICGGAALLASYQQTLHRPVGEHTAISGWFDAVRRYSQSPSTADSTMFARRVFTVIRSGESRVTNDGQRVSLSAVRGLAIPPEATPQQAPVDCPPDLNCEWIPAPYDWYGYPDPGAYGNHDIATRPSSPNIRYIVIHDTETTYDEALDLVQDPTYLAWNYTIRSSDGHVAQHLDANDIGWHAGNWYVNMHSIGIEHEGFAAQGATWFTESLYESSADLVKYLANEYDIPLDRAHIIGHDQVPGILRKYVAGMHWDPGPFWDWQHYFDLLGAPFEDGTRATSANVKPGTVVTVAPDFATNYNRVTGCDQPGVPCAKQGSNFVYLHVKPNWHSHLVKDIGLHKQGYSTHDVADIGARAAAGQKLVVAAVRGDWIGLWYLGELGWVDVPPDNSPLVISSGQLVTVKAGAKTAPVYGRAYPERSAYPSKVPYQRVSPLQYTIKKGQEYVLADDSPVTDYYRAVSYDDSAPHDHTDIVGKDSYDEIWFGHRIAYVRTADISVG